MPVLFNSVLFNIFLNHKGKSDLCKFDKKSMNVNVPMENQENKTNNYSFVQLDFKNIEIYSDLQNVNCSVLKQLKLQKC